MKSPKPNSTRAESLKEMAATWTASGPISNCFVTFLTKSRIRRKFRNVMLPDPSRMKAKSISHFLSGIKKIRIVI